MSLRIDFHELVDSDLEHAWHWYEDRERGLGDRFLAAIHATVVRASRWPNAGSPVLRDNDDEVIERKLPANGFPYAVRYRIFDDCLVVMAVLHQHRHPVFGNDRSVVDVGGDGEHPVDLGEGRPIADADRSSQPPERTT